MKCSRAPHFISFFFVSDSNHVIWWQLNRFYCRPQTQLIKRNQFDLEKSEENNTQKSRKSQVSLSALRVHHLMCANCELWTRCSIAKVFGVIAMIIRCLNLDVIAIVFYCFVSIISVDWLNNDFVLIVNNEIEKKNEFSEWISTLETLP